VLILARKQGEKIIILTKSGERIEITAVRVSGEIARIGIDADKERVNVIRDEVLHRMEVSKA